MKKGELPEMAFIWSKSNPANTYRITRIDLRNDFAAQNRHHSLHIRHAERTEGQHHA